MYLRGDDICTWTWNFFPIVLLHYCTLRDLVAVLPSLRIVRQFITKSWFIYLRWNDILHQNLDLFSAGLVCIEWPRSSASFTAHNQQLESPDAQVHAIPARLDLPYHT